MLAITAGHTVETGRKIGSIPAVFYNRGVDVYNDTGDPELARALSNLWDYILEGGSEQVMYQLITAVETLVLFWKVID